ncbi:MAG: zinc-ribbon domain-containing protein, partial [Actinomycetota bacterium]
MFCTNCGHRNLEGSNFCATCGAVLRPVSPQDTTNISLVLESEAEVDEGYSVPVDELEEGKGILLVRRGPNAGTKFFLDKPLVTCGRNPTSDIFLDDVTVSRKHAEIRRE